MVSAKAVALVATPPEETVKPVKLPPTALVADSVVPLHVNTLLVGPTPTSVAKFPVPLETTKAPPE
jgi:hypothetical protein